MVRTPRGWAEWAGPGQWGRHCATPGPAGGPGLPEPPLDPTLPWAGRRGRPPPTLCSPPKGGGPALLGQPRLFLGSWGHGLGPAVEFGSEAWMLHPLDARRAPLEHELGGWAGASGTWAGGGASSFGAGAGTHQFVVVINVLLPESTEVSGRQTHRCPTELGVQAGGASEVILTSGATTPWPFRG